MNDFLEFVASKNKTIECYRWSMGYINAKPTWYRRQGNKKLGIQNNDE